MNFEERNRLTLEMNEDYLESHREMINELEVNI